jgi:carbon storage regulator
MLIIRRRAGQSIRIGEDIEIHIADISPSKVMIGVLAPRDISVIRAEVALTREQNLVAADSLTAEDLAKLKGGLRLVR